MLDGVAQHLASVTLALVPGLEASRNSSRSSSRSNASAASGGGSARRFFGAGASERFAPGLGSDLENRDVGRQRCEAPQVTRIAGQHDATASGGTRDDRRVDDVGDTRRGAELACWFGERLVEGIYRACVDDARKASLLGVAPHLGECGRRDHRNDTPRNGLSPVGPEPAVVSVGSDQRASASASDNVEVFAQRLPDDGRRGFVVSSRPLRECLA